MDKINQLEIILKITECCNIKCTYCYYFEKNNHDFLNKPKYMKQQTVDHLVSFLKEAIATYEIELIQFDLHGGEPLMIGKKRFEQLVKTLHDGLHDLCQISFGLQTNATLIDDEWIDIFSRYNIAAGISIDGDEAIHNTYRLDYNGKGTYKKTIEGFQKVAQAAAEGLMSPPALLCVMNTQHDGNKIYRHFIDDLKVNTLYFTPPDLTLDDMNDEIKTNIDNYFLNIMDEWIKDNSPTLQINQQIRNFTEPLTSLIINDTELSKTMLGTNNYVVITIRSDGSLNPDDCLRNTHEHLFNDKYTIIKNTLKDYITSPEIKDLYKDIFTLPENCKNCSIKKLCKNGFGFGSIIQRYSKENQLNNQNSLCPTFQKISIKLCEYAIDKGKTWDTLTSALH